MIHIRLDDEGAIRALAQTALALQKGKPLFGILGEALRQTHKKRFEREQKSPEGEAWKALSPSYKAKKRKNKNKILIRDGYLKNTLRYQASDKGVVFGSDRKYARLHHFGSVKRRGRRSGVPARPWLGVSRQDKAYLLGKTEHFLKRVIGNR